jgi:class 3 adenylate cyclase
MEPRIQYTTTSDGVGIAWAEAGQGPALLSCGGTPWTHLQELFAMWGAAFEAFFRLFRWVTFDARGTGMSERDVAGVSAETLLLDAEAVIDAAKLDRFIVMADPGSILAISTCLRLAIAYPERVTHVVLESPFQNTRELADTPIGRTNLALAELDWAVYLQTLFRVLLGLDAASSEIVEAYVAAAGGWVDQPVGIQYVRTGENVDVSDLLPQVRQPTLVLRNDPYFVPARCCQRVAAKIPGAQFRQYSDPTYVQGAELIRAFVAQSSPPPAQLAPAASATELASGLTAILFADIVDSTALTERLGDTAFRDKARDLDAALRTIIRDSAGTPIEGKLLGDGVLAVFTSARQAIEAALACGRSGDDAGLPLHLGLHAGDVIREENNVYGGAVNIASRISGLSAPGEVLVSETVRSLARTSAGVSFEDRGEHSLKGIDDAVRVWAVRQA